MRTLLVVGLCLCVSAAALFVCGFVAAIRSPAESSPGASILMLVASAVELFGIALVFVSLRTLAKTDTKPHKQPGSPDAGKRVLYRDKIVCIFDDGLWFPVYYFPWGAKFVPFAEIERIVCLPPTMRNGKWRYWGTSSFRTFFPLDAIRDQRSVIFHAHLRGRWQRIGFTAEDSNGVRDILNGKVRVEDG